MKRLPRLISASLTVLALSVSMAAGTVGSASAAVRNCSTATYIHDRPVLRFNDQGSCVIIAKGLLHNVNTYNGAYTRTFDAATETAVRKAQRNAKIRETGVVDQRTWEVLAESSPATKRAFANSEIRNCDRDHYRTICVIKGNNGSAGKLYAIQKGLVLRAFDVRTSDSRNPNPDPYKVTSEGRLKVVNKARGTDYPLYYDDYTNATDNSNGQQAIRYSAIFRKCGYDGNLRGSTCVKDYRGAAFGGVDLSSQAQAKWLWGWSNTNTEIVILHDRNATV